MSILACIFGFYFLFAPLISLLAWIPLVGSLLAFALKIAAFLFALVVGATVACLVLGLAWLVFRPLIGITLLALVGVGIMLIFLPYGGSDTTMV